VTASRQCANSSLRALHLNHASGSLAPYALPRSSQWPALRPSLRMAALHHRADVYGQTKRCLEIILQPIADAGLGPQSVVRTRVMLTDIARWEEAARAHGEIFSEIRPACTFVQVSGFINQEWLVELEADCVDER